MGKYGQMIVKNYSRKTFKTLEYKPDEFYICINSSGGPHSEAILDPSLPNVYNIWFDDVEKDGYKYGNDTDYWINSKGITYRQAFRLYEFILTIPQDATVNVHCSAGRCRSGAVSQFLKNEFKAALIPEYPLDPNPRVLAYMTNAKYKYVQEINYSFDLDELRCYYHTVNKNYQHLKWTLALVDDVKDAHKHKLDGVYAWGIQSNLEDLTVPCPPYDVHKNGSTTYRNTELVFGFAEKLLERFPYARQLGIAAHPKGVEIAQHIDNDEFVKIHFPIFKTTCSFFVFGEHRFVFEPGKAYLIDTRYVHGTSQEGDGERIHLLVKLPVDKIEDALR